MSRCVLKRKDDRSDIQSIAVGIERGLWFIQVFGPDTPDGDETLFEDYEGSRWKVMEIIDKYADIEDPYTKRVREQVIMDLDPTLPA